ncbi:MAG: efflux RND transporter periplasmic adaptor subunit [Chloroflexota bacterium]
MSAILSFFKNKKMRHWVIAVLTAAALVWFGAGYSSANASQVNTVDDVQVISLDVAETIEASGTLEADPFSGLKWKTAGVVDVVYVEPGDKMHEGDVLMTLRPSSVSPNILVARAELLEAQRALDELKNSETALAEATLALDKAQADYDKAKEYRESLDEKITIKTVRWVDEVTPYGTITVPDVTTRKVYADDETKADADKKLALAAARLDDVQRLYDRLKDGPNPDDVAAAQARVDAAQATVDSISIIAPFDGQILWVESTPGSEVGTGMIAVYMADQENLFVEAQVDESDIANVKLGDQAEVRMDALPGTTLTGSVEAVNPVGQSVAGIVKFTVRIALDPVNGQTFLPLGATADVTVQVKDASPVLTVPLNAVQNDGEGEYVWLVQSDGSVTRVDIVSGDILGDYVVVTGDLHEGNMLRPVYDNSVSIPFAEE